MAAEFTMPQLGLTMTEGTLLTWFKSVGDAVALGDILVEVETEKVNYQVESTLEGELLQILVPEGEVAPVKAPLAVIGEKGETLQNIVKNSAPVAAPPRVHEAENATSPAMKVVNPDERLKASPLAKKIAREQNLKLEEIAGTGPGGRIVERDVQKHLAQIKVKASPLAEKIAREFNVDLSSMHKDSRIMKDDVLEMLPRQPIEQAASGWISAVPMAGMRKVIAERMTLSWQTTPHVNMTAEVDMTTSAELKQRLTQSSDAKISYTDIIVKCAARALTEFPSVNASLIDGKIISHDKVNIGVAVALDNGLIVPVIKNIDNKTLSQVHEEIVCLSGKARDGKLARDEVSGGTFTVSNLGMFGIDHFTPIINPPESAILGVCRIVERPLAEGGVVVIRPMMNLCFSFDHRLIDGAVGAQFLARLRQLLEQPLLLL